MIQSKFPCIVGVRVVQSLGNKTKIEAEPRTQTNIF